MKKILLSCACCLLAVGLLAGCDEDVEDVNPEDPNAGVVEPGDDDGGSTESGPVVVKTGKLGFLQENKGAYYYFTGELNDRNFGVCSTEFSEGADVTVSKEENSYYLSIEVESETLYLSCPDTEHSAMELSKDPYALVYNEEFDTFTTVDDTKFLGTYGDYDTLCWASLYYNGASNLGAANEFCASVFTTEPEAPELPEPIEPVIGTVAEGQYFLGVTMSEVTYYFDGTLSGYYGSVSSNGYDAAVVTVAAATDGYTLSFTDSEGATQYLYVYVDNGYVDLDLQEEAFTWQYDETFDTFVVEANNKWNFLGTYGTNQRLGMSDYGYLTGDVSSSYEQYPAKLFEVITYVAPTSITVSGETSVEVGGRITLTADVIGEGNIDPRITWDWSSEDGGAVTVYESGLVVGVTEGTVTVTATSVASELISGSITITVSEASGDAPTAYKLGAEDTTNYCYYWFNGKTTGSTYLSTSTDWSEAVDVYIDAVNDDTENTCTLSFYDDSGALKYITYPSDSTKLTIGDTPYTWTWVENEGNGYFKASDGRFIGELTSDGSFRAYASSNLSGYPHVQPFTEKPEDPEKPELDVTLEEVSSIESGQEYYLGAQSGEDYQLITGSVTNYKLPTTIDITGAAEVVATGNDTDGWTLTVNGKYIYAYVYSSNTLELGTSDAQTVPSSGVNVFTFDSTSHAFYTSASGAVTSSYTYSYLEYYSGNVCLYGSNSLTFSNAAHLYQVVDN